MVASISNKGLVSGIYKELLQLNKEKKKKTNLKWVKDLHRKFYREDIPMTNEHMKKC